MTRPGLRHWTMIISVFSALPSSRRLPLFRTRHDAFSVSSVGSSSPSLSVAQPAITDPSSILADKCTVFIYSFPFGQGAHGIFTKSISPDRGTRTVTHLGKELPGRFQGQRKTSRFPLVRSTVIPFSANVTEATVPDGSITAKKGRFQASPS